MNIKEMWEKRESLDTEIINIDAEVEERWNRFIDCECVFDRWHIDKKGLHVFYYYRNGVTNSTCYPMCFFEIEDSQKAVKAYVDYLKNERQKRINEAQIKQGKQDKKFKKGEKKLYLKLKEKYEK